MLRIEALHEAAQSPDYANVPVAVQPRMFFTPETALLLGAVEMDMDMVYDLAKPRVGSQALGAMALRFVRREWRLVNDGCVYDDPEVINGQVRYPVIDIAIDPQRPNVTQANRILRHELRHVMQPAKTASYNEKEPPAFARASLLSVASQITAGAVMSDRWWATMPGAVVAASLAASNTGVFGVLHAFSPQEADAHLFAARTSAYRPLSIAR